MCSDTVELWLSRSSSLLAIFCAVDLGRWGLLRSCPVTAVFLAALNWQPERASYGKEKQPVAGRMGLEQRRPDQ